MIYSIHTSTPFAHNDCVMLVEAQDSDYAIERAINETTILDLFNESNVCAYEVKGIKSNANEFGNYIHLFSDDIEYL